MSRASRLAGVILLVSLGCGRKQPPPQAEPQQEAAPEPEADPAVTAALREATESCTAVAKAVEAVRTPDTATAAVTVLRAELPKLRKVRDRLPEAPPERRPLPPAAAEFLEAIIRLGDAEIRLIDATRASRNPVAETALDQISVELRRYTDELHAIRKKLAP